MANPAVTARRSADGGTLWLMRGVFAVLTLVLLVVQLLPLGLLPAGWVGPDLVFAFALVWVARRPDFAPVWLLAGLFLLADLLLQRPPGLWAAMALLATEALRARAQDLRDMVFAGEWAIVAVILTGFTAAFLALWSLLVPYDIPRGLFALQMLLTLAAYPPVAGASVALFGVTKAAPGQTDALGRKL
ncbi:MAG: rod shape-determining protein MreD [Pseudomonadota bacterium]